METKANYVLVGLFTVIVFLLAVILFTIFTSFSKSANLQRLDVIISGSASGLALGSPVLFNGIAIGDVKKLSLDPNNPNFVIAQTMVNKTAPITTSSQAFLSSQGVTGVCTLEIKGGNVKEPLILKEAEKTNSIATIHAKAASINNILSQAQLISHNIESTVIELQNTIKDIRVPLTRTLENTEKITSTVIKNIDLINQSAQAAKNINEISVKIKGIVNNLDQLLTQDSKNSLIKKIQGILNSVQDTAESLNKHVKPIAQNIENISGRSFNDIENVIFSVNRSIERIEQAITALQKEPSRIIWGGETRQVPSYNGEHR